MHFQLNSTEDNFIFGDQEGFNAKLPIGVPEIEYLQDHDGQTKNVSNQH